MNGENDSRWSGPSASAGRRGSAPRPTWMIVLSSLMFVWALLAFQMGLTTIRTVGAAPVAGPTHIPGLSLEESLRRELEGARVATDRALPRATTALGIANLALAGVLLFAVAAIATNDARGRAAALAAGAAGIAFHVANSLYFVSLFRGAFLARLEPRVTSLLAARPVTVGMESAEGMMELVSTATIVVPVVSGVVGIGFSVIVLRLFGGPRGRAFYGVPFSSASRAVDGPAGGPRG